MSEGPTYGYGKRPPTATGRVIPSGTPPSRISAPDSSSSRKTSAATKQILESAVPVYTNGFLAPTLGALTNLNSITVSPSGPNGWASWEYNAASTTYQVNTFNAVQNGTANSPVARSNVGVLTKRMLATLGAYRGADATGMAVYLCFGVPPTTIGSYDNTDYWRIGLVRNAANTALLAAEYVPFTGALSPLLPSVTMPTISWLNLTSIYLFVAIDGGHVSVYTHTADDFSAATLRFRCSAPPNYYGLDGEVRNTQAGVVLVRGSATNMWFFLTRFESNPVAFAP